MNHNVFDRLLSPARRAPARLAIETDGGERYTAGDVELTTARYAGVLAREGLKPGDRVAAQLDKSPESLFLYLACLRCGLVYLPLNTAYRRSELAHFFDDAEPALVVARPGDAAAVADLLPPAARVYTLDSAGRGSLADAASAVEPRDATHAVSGDDTAAIVYTSGTTGRPKGAMITHDNLAANAETLVTAWGFTPDDVLLHVLPLYHVHGLFIACHCALWSGASMRFIMQTGTDELLHHLPGATVMMGVPTHYTRLLAGDGLSPQACRTMRLFISGSAPLPPHTFHDFEQRTGHRILERYGMTETGMNTSNPLAGPRVPGTVGQPLPGVAVCIRSGAEGDAAAGHIGMLQVKGRNVFKGYWRQPGRSREEFTHDGWFITGDLASMDADGYVRIEGRSKDLIISGGYNVYPKEVELCIDDLSGVAESAVIGLPDPDWGEAVCVAIVCEPGAKLDEASVIDHVRRTMAPYKAPKSVHFVDELPRNAMGKVQKNVLREQYS